MRLFVFLLSSLVHRTHRYPCRTTWGEKKEDKKINEYTVSISGVEVRVSEFLVADSSENRQAANFEYQGVHYQLKGVMKTEEFKKILENLYFF